jgi:hypothetical protein
VLRCVCTNLKLNEINNLTVLTVCFYKKSDLVERKEELLNILEK